MQSDYLRDEQVLVAIRPTLLLEIKNAGPEEVFQNQTLRPILKMQHDVLVQLFQQYIHKRKDAYFKFSKEDRLEWIAHSIRTDLRFRNIMIGVIVGHFTLAELQVFQENESNYMRRLTDLLVQRLRSVAYEA